MWDGTSLAIRSGFMGADDRERSIVMLMVGVSHANDHSTGLLVLRFKARLTCYAANIPWIIRTLPTRPQSWRMRRRGFRSLTRPRIGAFRLEIPKFPPDELLDLEFHSRAITSIVLGRTRRILRGSRCPRDVSTDIRWSTHSRHFVLSIDAARPENRKTVES